MCTILAVFFGPLATSRADPVSGSPTTKTRPDAPPRPGRPTSGDAKLPPSWDLDGVIIWLGPAVTLAHHSDQRDTSFGAHLAITRVRERAPLATLGVAVQGAMWSERDAGRITLDAVAGTNWHRMVGVSVGGVLELSDSAHPRVGATAGVWAFVGVTPFARVGIAQEIGTFGEVGLAIAFPAWRSR